MGPRLKFSLCKWNFLVWSVITLINVISAVMYVAEYWLKTEKKIEFSAEFLNFCMKIPAASAKFKTAQFIAVFVYFVSQKITLTPLLRAGLSIRRIRQLPRRPTLTRGSEHAPRETFLGTIFFWKFVHFLNSFFYCCCWQKKKQHTWC